MNSIINVENINKLVGHDNSTCNYPFVSKIGTKFREIYKGHIVDETGTISINDDKTELSSLSVSVLSFIQSIFILATRI